MDVTPEQARFVYEHMSQEQKDRLADWIQRLPEIIEKVDRALTDVGQRMADDAEVYANGGHLGHGERGRP